MTSYSIRVVVPYHLQTLAKIESEIRLDVSDPVTHERIIDAIESTYPMLVGTIRDHVTKKRRPLLRYFVCSTDVSHEPPDRSYPPCTLRSRAVHHLGSRRGWLTLVR